MRMLFVGNLPSSLTEGGLMDLFDSPSHPVTSTRLGVDADMESRGYGWVFFTSDAAAEAARIEIDGLELEGHAIGIRVGEGRPMP